MQFEMQGFFNLLKITEKQGQQQPVHFYCLLIFFHVTSVNLK